MDKLLDVRGLKTHFHTESGEQWRDLDIQVLWEFQNLGLGNLAKVRERRAENAAAIIELFRLQDRIAGTRLVPL